MENITYKNIVKNLDTTINNITARMELIAASGIMSGVTEYTDLRNQRQYYGMLRAACVERIRDTPKIGSASNIACPVCDLPLLEDFLNCPMCGKKLNWEPLLYKDGVKVARNDNGYLKENRPKTMCKDGVCQLSIFEEDN